QAPIESRVVDFSFRDSQQVVQCCCQIPSLFNCQFTARFAPSGDRQQRCDSRPGHICRFLVDALFPESIQLQTLPEFQPHVTVSKLPAPFEAYLVQQDLCNVGIVLRRLDLGGKQLQLPAFTLLVEDLDALKPSC